MILSPSLIVYSSFVYDKKKIIPRFADSRFFLFNNAFSGPLNGRLIYFKEAYYFFKPAEASA